MHSDNVWKCLVYNRTNSGYVSLFLSPNFLNSSMTVILRSYLLTKVLQDLNFEMQHWTCFSSFQVFLGHSGAHDIEGNELPRLVYVSREKRPGYQHHKKAGAENALVCLRTLFKRKLFSTYSSKYLIWFVLCDCCLEGKGVCNSHECTIYPQP